MLLRTRNHAAFVSLSLGLTLVQAAFMPPLPLSYGYTQTFSFANQNNFSAPIAGAQTAFDGTVDGNMTLYFLSRNNVYAVHMLPPFVPYVFAGVADSCCTISNPTLATQAIFTYPEGILFDCHSRYLYVADTGGRCIWRIDTQPMAATVSSFSGDCHTGSASVNDGIGVAGLYKAPRHLALWGADVMVADLTCIRRLSTTNARLFTFAGPETSYTCVNTGRPVGTGYRTSVSPGEVKTMSIYGGNVVIWAVGSSLYKIVGDLVSIVTVVGLPIIAVWTHPTERVLFLLDGTASKNLFVAEDDGFGNPGTSSLVISATPHTTFGVTNAGAMACIGDSAISMLSGSMRGWDLECASKYRHNYWRDRFEAGLRDTPYFRAGSCLDANAALFVAPIAVANRFGDVFVADGGLQVVWRVVLGVAWATPQASIHWGDASGISGLTEGTGATARFSRLTGICADPSQPSVSTMLVSDGGSQVIRSISTNTAVTSATVAGNPNVAGDTEGSTMSETFNNPSAIQCQIPADNLVGAQSLVVDRGNHRIKIIRHFVDIATVVGTGVAGSTLGGTGITTQLNDPSAVAFVAMTSFMYVADRGNHRVLSVNLNVGGSFGTTALVFGATGDCYDDPSAAPLGKLCEPAGLVFSPGTFKLYISNAHTHTIVSLNLQNAARAEEGGGRWEDLGGPEPYGGQAGNAGPWPATTRFNTPTAMTYVVGGAADGAWAHSVIIVDEGNLVLRELRPFGPVVPGAATWAYFTLCPSNAVAGYDDGNAAGGGTRFSGPAAVAASSDHVFVVERTGHKVRVYNKATRLLSTWFGLTRCKADICSPAHVTLRSDGMLIVSRSNKHLDIFTSVGPVQAHYAGSTGSYTEHVSDAKLAGFVRISAIAAARSSANLYVGDSGRIRVIVGTLTVTSPGGTDSLIGLGAASQGNLDGDGSIAQVAEVRSIVVDASGHLVFLNSNYGGSGRSIRRLHLSLSPAVGPTRYTEALYTTATLQFSALAIDALSRVFAATSSAIYLILAFGRSPVQHQLISGHQSQRGYHANDHGPLARYHDIVSLAWDEKDSKLWVVDWQRLRSVDELTRTPSVSITLSKSVPPTPTQTALKTETTELTTTQTAIDSDTRSIDASATISVVITKTQETPTGTVTESHSLSTSIDPFAGFEAVVLDDISTTFTAKGNSILVLRTGAPYVLPQCYVRGVTKATADGSWRMEGINMPNATHEVHAVDVAAAHAGYEDASSEVLQDAFVIAHRNAPCVAPFMTCTMPSTFFRPMYDRRVGLFRSTFTIAPQPSFRFSRYVRLIPGPPARLLFDVGAWPVFVENEKRGIGQRNEPFPLVTAIVDQYGRVLAPPSSLQISISSPNGCVVTGTTSRAFLPTPIRSIAVFDNLRVARPFSSAPDICVLVATMSSPMEGVLLKSNATLTRARCSTTNTIEMSPAILTVPGMIHLVNRTSQQENATLHLRFSGMRIPGLGSHKLACYHQGSYLPALVRGPCEFECLISVDKGIKEVAEMLIGFATGMGETIPPATAVSHVGELAKIAIFGTVSRLQLTVPAVRYYVAAGAPAHVNLGDIGARLTLHDNLNRVLPIVVLPSPESTLTLRLWLQQGTRWERLCLQHVFSDGDPYDAKSLLTAVHLNATIGSASGQLFVAEATINTPGKPPHALSNRTTFFVDVDPPCGPPLFSRLDGCDFAASTGQLVTAGCSGRGNDTFVLTGVGMAYRSVRRVIVGEFPCAHVRLINGSSELPRHLLLMPRHAHEQQIVVSGCPAMGWSNVEAHDMSIFFGDGTFILLHGAVHYKWQRPATAAIEGMSGCPVDAFPATAFCPLRSGGLSPRTHITIVGKNFDTLAVAAVRFANSSNYRVSCTTFVLSANTHVICKDYRGFGKNLVAELVDATGIVVLRGPRDATVNFVDSNGDACPLAIPGDLTSICGNGTCDAAAGRCDCFRDDARGHWQGDACDQCVTGFGGPSCTDSCPRGPNNRTCDGWGDCDNITLACTCYAGRSGPDCNSECPGGADNPCHGNGDCDITGPVPSCLCAQNATNGYWSGSSCAECSPGWAPPFCNVSCPMSAGSSCNGHGSCTPSGVCVCGPGYCGSACELTGGCSLCTPTGYYGSMCDLPCPGGAELPCHGHGLCAEGTTGNGQCLCYHGWSTFDCGRPCNGGEEYPCSGHGTCLPGSGQCVCDPLFGTADCSQRCPGTPFACSGHGTCYDGAVNTALCVCDQGFTGSDCGEPCPGANRGPACYGHGICRQEGCDCFDEGATGHWSGADCTRCAQNWYGSLCNDTCSLGKDTQTICAGHGTCLPTLECHCDASPERGYWTGEACDECAPGFYGLDCREECPGGVCYVCGGRGTCSDGKSGKGTCTCDRSDGSLFGNADCTDCAAGFFGPNCNLTCPTAASGGVCAGHGICSDGITGNGFCNCMDGFAATNFGGLCDTCQSFHFGPQCAECRPNASLPCFGHGTCADGPAGNGLCTCSPHFIGSTCAVQCPTSFGLTCGGHGTCYASTVDPNEVTPGWCMCQSFWSNASGACDDCIPGRWSGNCLGQCPVGTNGQVCSGNGICIDGRGGDGSCNCTHGFWGSTCDKICAGGSIVPCSGHGRCRGTDGVCVCYSDAVSGHWIGAACDLCHPAWQSTGCIVACPTNGWNPPLVCNNRGTCNEGLCTDCAPNPELGDVASSICGQACELGSGCPNSCPAGFAGANCDVLCPGATSDGNGACGGHGVCRRSSATCRCATGYGGIECQLACLRAVDGTLCSGHGLCNLVTGTGCECIPGWGTANCEVACPTTGAAVCSGHGACRTEDAVCACDLGFVGSACNFECRGGHARPCNLHGECDTNTGACTCHSTPELGFWGGDACESCLYGYSGVNCQHFCVNGYPGATECVCLEGFGGPDCSQRCPADELDVLCFGHGACDQGAQGTGTCDCFVDWFGKACTDYCTKDHCKAIHQMQFPLCDGNGTCVCQDDSRGHFIGARCDTCKDQFWGPTCALACPCNGNGDCSRNTGECLCYRDDIRGYWDGQSCTVCASGFIGLDCRGWNVQLSTNVDRSTEHRVIFESVSPLRVLSVLLPPNLVLLGNSPLLLVNITAAPPIVLQQLPLEPNYLAIASFSRGNDLIVVSENLITGATKYHRLNEAHEVVSEVFGPTGGYPSGAPASRQRSLLSLSSELQVGVFPHLGWDTILTVFRNGVVSFRPGPAASPTPPLFVVAPNIGKVHRASVDANALNLFVTSSIDGRWALVSLIVPFTGAPVWTVRNQASDPIPACFASPCLALERCLVAPRWGVPALFCVVSTQGTVAAALLPIPNVSNFTQPLSVGFGALLFGAGVDVTAMVADEAADTGLIATNEAGLGSTITKVKLTDFLLSGQHTLGFVGTDPEIAVGFVVKASERELLVQVQLPFIVKIISFNLFGVRRIVPDILDSAGGAVVNVFGEGFNNFAPPLCDFGNGVPEAAVIVSAHHIICRVGKDSAENCRRIDFNLQFGNRHTTTTNVPVLRPAAAAIESLATGEHGEYGPYGSDTNGTRVTLVGRGFVQSPFAACRVVDSRGRLAFATAASGGVQYVNSTATVCIQPPGATATVPPALLAYTHDGQVYSPASTPYAVVGEAAKVSVRAASTTVRAAAVCTLGEISVMTVDRNGNPLLHLDQPKYGGAFREVTAQLLLMGNANDATVFANGTVTTVTSSLGVARFDALRLDRPKVGQIALLFATIITGVYADSLLRITVVVGEPTVIAFGDPAMEGRRWVISTFKVAALDPPAEMVIADAAGNKITADDELPPLMTIEYFVEFLSDGALESRTATAAALSRSGTYKFPEIFARGLYGSNYDFRFAVPSGYRIPPLVVRNIPLQRCSPGSEYGVLGTSECRRCPEFGICDGSTQVRVQIGAFRTSPDSFTFYSCDPPYSSGESCGNGTCLGAYLGPRCSICESGYGRTGLRCVRCEARPWVNWVVIVVVCLTFLSAAFVLLLVSVKVGAVDEAIGLTTKDSLPIIVKMLVNHVQVSVLCGINVADAPKSLINLFANVKSGSTLGIPEFVYFDCQLGGTYIHRYVAVCFVIPLATLIAFSIAMVVIVHIRNRRSVRQALLQQEFEMPAPDIRALRVELEGDEESTFDVIAALRDDVLAAADDPRGAAGDGMGPGWNNEVAPADEVRIHESQEAAGRPETAASNTSGTAPQSVKQQQRNPLSTSEVLDAETLQSRQMSAIQVIAVSSVVVLFLFYPTILEAAVEMLRCDTLDFGSEGLKRFLHHDRRISCDTATYRMFAASAYVVLLVVGVGVPLYSVVVVNAVASLSLQGDRSRARVLFFFTTGGFFPSHYFWESVVMARKGLITLLIVVVSDLHLRSLGMMWCIGLMLCLTAWQRPYADAKLSALESASLICIYLTTNLGQLFALEIVKRSTVAQNTIFWAIVVINTLTLFGFAVLTAGAVRGKITSLYLSAPQRWWFLRSCSAVVEDDTQRAQQWEAQLRLRLELHDLERASNVLLYDVHGEVLHAAQLLEDFYPNEIISRDALTKYRTFCQLTEQRIAVATFGPAEMEARGIVETQLCEALLALVRRDKRIADRRSDEHKRGEAAEASRVRMQMKLAEHRHKEEFFDAAFDPLSEKTKLSQRPGRAAQRIARLTELQRKQQQRVAVSPAPEIVFDRKAYGFTEIDSDDEKSTSHERSGTPAVPPPVAEAPMERREGATDTLPTPPLSARSVVSHDTPRHVPRSRPDSGRASTILSSQAQHLSVEVMKATTVPETLPSRLDDDDSSSPQASHAGATRLFHQSAISESLSKKHKTVKKRSSVDAEKRAKLALLWGDAAL